MKYSIIVPVQNSIKYLPATINSVLNQNYDDFELIISDDSSIDGTSEYIDSLNNFHIKVLHTPHEMLVNEHFMFAQSYATGDWQMFLGGDDFLQPYFFEYADKLVSFAEKKEINAICSERSYYFWEGLESVYGTMQSSYHPKKEIKIQSSVKTINKILFNQECYFNYAQMYTTSLFSKKLIEKIKNRQNGKLIVLPVSDVSLVASSLYYENKYLYSGIPLGIVGTSPKSVFRTDKDKKKLRMPDVYGAYEIGVLSNYFRAALTEIGLVNNNKSYQKKIFLIKYFSKNYNELNVKKDLFDQMLLANHVSRKLIFFCAKIINLLKKIKAKILNKILVKNFWFDGQKKKDLVDLYLDTAYGRNSKTFEELYKDIMFIYYKYIQDMKIN